MPDMYACENFVYVFLFGLGPRLRGDDVKQSLREDTLLRKQPQQRRMCFIYG
jgi:hypothetical protein